MHQKFIVSGVGRSGTTAMAGALNLHPAVFCAVEQVHQNEDHRGLLEDGEVLLGRGESRHQASNAAVWASKTRGELLAVGNKFPGYFRAPRRR